MYRRKKKIIFKNVFTRPDKHTTRSARRADSEPAAEVFYRANAIKLDGRTRRRAARAFFVGRNRI